ncbi:MAG: V-type ATP synthase subunit A, partial [Bacteroidales bacterium]|nr:V-type ATP synthase subunit A [Bacteroidales bacterium]
MKTTGIVTGIISNLVTVKVDGPVAQNEICYVDLAGTKLMAEVIKVTGENAFIQVYESTRGLKGGDKVEFEGHMLEVTLGPGLLSGNYDGLQNNLSTMEGVFLKRGEQTFPLDLNKEWDFTPLANVGDTVVAADWLGEVKEGWLPHKIMVPFIFEGEYTVKSIAEAGQYKVSDVVAVLTDAKGEDHNVTMMQKWPVKVAVGGYREKPRPYRVMETGVRCIDTLNPIAEGGTGFIPGPFGCGKTVLQHAIAKQGEADVIVMAACGERANEVVEIFTEFPELIDSRTGRKLMERTTIVCNTS